MVIIAYYFIERRENPNKNSKHKIDGVSLTKYSYKSIHGILPNHLVFVKHF